MTLPPIHRMPYSPCPRCRHPLDSAASLTQPKAPKHGDLTVCMRCAARLTFERSVIGQLSVRELTPAEFAALDPDERAEVETYERAVLAVPDKRGGKA